MNEIDRSVTVSAWIWLSVALLVLEGGTTASVVIGPSDGIIPYLIDSAKRVVIIGILVGIPSLRWAYRVPEEEKEASDAVLWLARTGVLAAAMIVEERLSFGLIGLPLTEEFPNSALFVYPGYANETLRLFDLTIGMFLIGLSEELLFRRALIEMLLKQGWPRIATVFASAIPFAGIHWYGGIAHVAYALPFGILAAWIYLQFRSLWMLVVIHAVVDLCVFGYFDPR